MAIADLCTTVEKQFNILEELGNGSFGTVYKVEKDGSEYALKISKQGSGDSLRAEYETISEIQPDSSTIKSFGKPFCIKNGDVTELGLLLELCTPVEQLLESIRYRFSSEVPKMVVHLLRSLKSIHKKNFQHFDPYLRNYLFCNGIYKVADLGMAIKLEDNEMTGNYQIGDIERMLADIFEESEERDYLSIIERTTQNHITMDVSDARKFYKDFLKNTQNFNSVWGVNGVYSFLFNHPYLINV